MMKKHDLKYSNKFELKRIETKTYKIVLENWE
jgi:hypothetical protein